MLRRSYSDDARVANIAVINVGVTGTARSHSPLVTRSLAEDADDGRLWQRAVDLCVVPAEERAGAHFGGSSGLPAALIHIDVSMPSGRRRANASILTPLTTNNPMLLRSLRGLKIASNDYDESAALGAFAEQATDLRELTFWFCGLTSVRGLEGGRCECLRKVNLEGCHQLTSLDGLESYAFLEEVDASKSAIRSLEPLRTCRRLRAVYVDGCRQLSSLQGIEGCAQWLEVVHASHTSITSIEPLRFCDALTKVDLNGSQLASIQGLEGRQRLKEIYLSCTAITSIEPLQACPALKIVDLRFCERLSSIQVLENHQYLQEVNASYTGISTVEPLRSCPVLKTVRVEGCSQLPADARLAEGIEVDRGYSCWCCGVM